MTQLDAQNGSLQLIQAAVQALQATDVSLPPAVLPQQPYLLRQSLIIRDNDPPVAACPQVLGGVETEGGNLKWLDLHLPKGKTGPSPAEPRKSHFVPEGLVIVAAFIHEEIVVANLCGCYFPVSSDDSHSFQ